MPRIDFDSLRRKIKITQVLDLLEMAPRKRRGVQRRGSCPFGCSHSAGVFVAYLDTNRYYCFHCRSSGNAIELWATLHDHTFYEAALDLCRQLAIDVPYLDD